jgi:hypothetical protein
METMIPTIDISEAQLHQIQRLYEDTATADAGYGEELDTPELDVIAVLRAIGSQCNINFRVNGISLIDEDITAEEILQEARDNVPDQQV